MKKTIQEMVKDKYESTELQRAIVDHAKKSGTIKAIESGKLSLPSEPDAQNWLAAEQAKTQQEPTESD